MIREYTEKIRKNSNNVTNIQCAKKSGIVKNRYISPHSSTFFIVLRKNHEYSRLSTY